MITLAQNAIFLDEQTENGRPFKARFLQAGLVKYDFGVCLLKKETIDKFVDTFMDNPVIIGHKDIIYNEDKVGEIQHIWFSAEDGWFWCSGVLTSQEAIDLIQNGYSVSCQYRITNYKENRAGRLHNGNPYDKEILDGVFEHLAIVKNPRYEEAMIAVNAIIDKETDKKDTLDDFTEIFYEALTEVIAENCLKAENERWITIHPHGDDSEDYRRLKLEEGESPKEAIDRVYKKEEKGEEKKQKKEEPKENNDEEIEKQIEDLAKQYNDIDKEYWGVSWVEQDKRKELGEKREEIKEKLAKIGTMHSAVGKTWKNADGDDVTFMGYDADAKGYKVKTSSGKGIRYVYYQNIGSVKKLEKADTAGYEKATEKKSRKQGTMKALKVGTMPKAKSVEEATKLAKEYGLADNVNFGKLSLDICNAMNESANDNLAEFPKIREMCKEFGSLQGRNKSLVEEAIDIKGESLAVAIRDRIEYMRKTQGEEYVARFYGNEKKIEKAIAEKVTKRVKDILSIGKASGEIAHCKYYPPSQAGIVWNEKFKDSKNFDYTVGFHPEGATSLKAICDHEFGHQIHRYIKENKKYGKDAKYNELENYYRSLNKDEIANGLSRYANTNMSEWISEGYAEYKNNPNCRPMAKKIGELLTAAYKEVANG